MKNDKPLLLAAMCLMFASRAFAGPTSKGFTPTPDRPGDYGVSLEIVGGKTHYKLGEPLALRFRCTQPGHLTIISIDSNGNVVLMYPNKWATDSKVAANGTIDIPGKSAGFKLVARPPLGTTYVRAFMTPEPLVEFEDEEEKGGFCELGKSSGARMNQLMNKIKGFEPQPDKPADEAMAVITVRLFIDDDKQRRADGKILGEVSEGADLDGLVPPAHPKAKLLAALRDGGLGYGKHHEKGLAIPPTFSFDDAPRGSVSGAESHVIEQREESVELLVEPANDFTEESRRLKSMRVERVRGSAADIRAARHRLARGGARSVQTVVRYRAFGPSSPEPLARLQWALHNEFSRAADTAAIEAIGKAVKRPVVVAVVDTGMAEGHPDLMRALYRNEREVPGNGKDDEGNGLIDDVSGYDFVEEKGSHLAGASHDHGTFVSSVIAARADGRGIMGVCPWAEILPLRAGGLDGNFATPAIVRALLYAGECGAKIVNCSWGGYGDDPAIYRAMQVLREKGVLIVCAAGNEANDNDNNPATPASYDLDNIISVAALRVDGELASFSNWGAQSVHLAAPGELILGYADASGDAQAWDGTSFAAPMVAGAAALVWAKHPDWNYSQVKSAIMASTRRMKQLDGKVSTGGMLDVAAAIAG